jgi:hypothetical protein
MLAAESGPVLSERDARSPRPEAPSSSLVLSQHSRHVPSITRTTEREACPVEQHRSFGEGRLLRTDVAGYSSDTEATGERDARTATKPAMTAAAVGLNVPSDLAAQ